MAAFHSLRPSLVSVSQAVICRGRSVAEFGRLQAHEAACRVHKGAWSSCLHISRGAVRSVSGSAMTHKEVQEEEEEEEEKGEVSSSGSGAPKRAPLVVLSFYKFADLPDYEQMRAPLKELCETNFVSGGIILAPEGINGSICGTREAVEVVMSAIQSDERLAGLRRTEAPADLEDEEIHHGHSSKSPLGAGENAPFRWDHVRVKLKKEVVSMGLPDVNPAKKVGKYVKPKDWNKLISDPNTVVVDVRNSYEIRVGKFKRAVDPQTDSFRQFPAWVDQNLGYSDHSGLSSGAHQGQVEEPMQFLDEIRDTSCEETTELRSPQRIAMYCTGGIRCEKATSYLVEHGFDEVYHLEGGILKYLEETPPSESLWEGDCFVFDKRVAVGHALKQGTYRLCYACKEPVNSTDMESPLWEEGVSCPYCYFKKSEAERARARARHEQFLHWGVIGGPDKGRKPTQSTTNSGDT